jgi:hypothetical protein
MAPCASAFAIADQNKDARSTTKTPSPAPARVLIQGPYACCARPKYMQRSYTGGKREGELFKRVSRPYLLVDRIKFAKATRVRLAGGQSPGPEARS